jgi:hypothetical protein
MLILMRDGGEAPVELVRSICGCLMDIENGLESTAMEEAKRILRRFYSAVDEHPQTFTEGEILPAIRRLERAIGNVGVRFAELDTTRHEIFKLVRRRTQGA